jgi:hypothetical protein
LRSAFTDHGGFRNEVNLVYALHFSLLYVEDSAELFKAILSYFGRTDLR